MILRAHLESPPADFVSRTGQWLRSYQRRLIQDTARRIIVLKARQIGMSTAICLRALREVIARKYHDVMLASTSLREAKELIRTCEQFIEILQHTHPGYQKADCQKTRIEFPNGSRILALPALKIRSRSGTVILDEAAMISRDQEVWQGMAPAADANEDTRIILISTPFGRSGLFWEIWSGEGSYGNWSKHKIDVFKAVDEGFPVNPEELQENYPKDVWRQEFCCEFGADEDQYFPHHLLREAQVDAPPAPFDAQSVGIDLASTNHASVMVPVRDAEGQLHILPSEMLKPAGTSRKYSEQYEDITDHIDRTPYDRVAVDGTGEGAQIAQDLRSEYSDVKVWKSAHWKDIADTVRGMKGDMESGDLRLVKDQHLVRAFSRVRKKERSDKSWKFEAEEDRHGHADEFYAALMGVDALTASGGSLGLGKARSIGKNEKVM